MKLALTTVLGILFGSIAVEGPFREATFEEALAAAKAEEKVVMIDFFTTWCAPCKQLDETTWKDAGVVAWLDENAVALKLDAEIEVDLAKRHEVIAYPTILFLGPDGQELERLLGYRTAEVFLKEAADTLVGRTAADRASEKLVGHETDPFLRMELGRALALAGQSAEALAEFLWCFDHGQDPTLVFEGVRTHALLREISNLGKKYPPARVALVERRDLARTRILQERSPGRAMEEFLGLNDAMGEKEVTIELYEQLRGLEGKSEVIQRLMKSILLPMMEQRRYEEVLAGSASIADWLNSKRDMLRRFEGERPEFVEVRAFTLNETLRDGGNYYEAILGAAGTAAAMAQPSVEEFEEQLLAIDGTSYNYSRLIKHATRAGAFGRARALVARAESVLTEKKDLRRIQRAAKKIPKVVAEDSGSDEG